MYMSELSRWNLELLDFMDDLVRVFDKTGFIVYTNQSMKNFLENEEGKYCLFSDDNNEVEKIYSSLKCVAPLRKNDDIVTELLTIDNREFLVKSSPVYDDNNQYWGCVEVFRDVTEENKLHSNLIKYSERTKNDMLVASDIQRSLLSRINHIEGINLEYEYLSSEQLSGDFFDVIELEDDMVCAYMADVMGHGISASMITMYIKFSIRSITRGRKITKPKEILNELAKGFSKLNVEIYFTIFLGIYNKKTSEFEYSNAGHNCIPILYNDTKNVKLSLSGFPITWLFLENSYSTGNIKLKKGDTVLFYTDGLTETKDKDRNEYGEERFLSVIDKYKNEVSDKELLEMLLQNVSQFRYGVQEDDIALLSMRVL